MLLEEARAAEDVDEVEDSDSEIEDLANGFRIVKLNFCPCVATREAQCRERRRLHYATLSYTQDGCAGCG